MRNTFLLASAVAGLAASAMAGDTVRFDVGFASVEIFPGNIDSNAVVTPTADPGRYFAAFGWSNVDIDVCWNTGAGFSAWASEVNFAMTMDEGAGAAELFQLASPFAGDDTGSDVEGACANRQALDELQTEFAPFTYSVDATGDVTSGLFATWDDGTGLRHSFCNTASFFFVLAGDAPIGCQGATGACGEANGSPGCDDVTCCALVCDSSGDPFCCDSSWDSTCAELALALCGIFQYSCDAPGEANDCVADAVMLGNGDSASFSTLNATNDGPAFTCAVGATDGVFADVWYMVEIDAAVDQLLTASTCDAADYDTALSIFDAGPIGSTFDPTTLPDVLVGCNDDGGGCTGFTSILNASVTAGRQYLIAVAGYEGAVGTGTLTVSWVAPEPPIDPYTCDAPGPDSFSQTVAGAVLQDNGVACAGAGITTAQKYARVYTAADMGADTFTIDCVEFGIANSGSYIAGSVNLYTVASGIPSITGMTLLASAPYGFYPTAGAEFSLVSFDGGVLVDLSGGESLVIELDTDASLDGFAGPAGGVAADVSSGETWGYAADCGDPDYVTYASFGSDFEWFVNVQGTAGGGGTPCPADFNGDGVVNGADFGSILAAWGPCPAPCPEDLNGDGVVNGADVGGLLASWGACP